MSVLSNDESSDSGVFISIASSDWPSSPSPSHSSDSLSASSAQMALFKQQTTSTAQYKINYICSCLNNLKIENRKDLTEKIDKLMIRILQNPNIFDLDNSVETNFTVFKEAISAYNRVYSGMINIKNSDIYDFQEILNSFESEKGGYDDSDDDLILVTSSYDALNASRQKIGKTSQIILNLLSARDHAVCPAIILGTGDTGTTIWLEKYRKLHGTSRELFESGNFPEVLMIGEDFGYWWHDYTLGQRHNLLERVGAPANPCDYLPQHAYDKNSHVNARHLHQANLVNLAATDAPTLLGVKVVRIENRENNKNDWREQDYEYRIITMTEDGIKEIYTRSIDICTGPGPARNPLIGDIISQNEFNELSKFDPNKNFTPIIDGNAFILHKTEENCPHPRTIVIYGGGATGSACFRKAFHGTDIATAELPFHPQLSKNKVAWHASNGFATAGKGKLPTAAISGAKQLNALHINTLEKISYDESTDKLKLLFRNSHSDDLFKPASFTEVECDQLVYSLGQEAALLKSICSELEDDLELHYDVADMPTCVRTKDQNIHFFGSAAMTMRPKEFGTGTWEWLTSENISPDVGPGAMPPSRSQIKQYLTRSGTPLESVNANVDSRSLISEFLQGAGIDKSNIPYIVDDILAARKESVSGCSYQTLRELLKTHKIDDFVRISGHGHLIYADN